VGKKLAIVKNV